MAPPSPQDPLLALTDRVEPDPPELPPRTRHRIAWVVLAVALLAFGLWLLWDFLAALVWATVFAIATWPVYDRFRQLFRTVDLGGVIAPLLFTIVIGVVFIGPLALLAIAVGREALFIARWVPSVEQTGLAPPDWLGGLPLIGHYAVDWWRTNLADPHSATALLGRLDRSVVVEWTRTLGTQLLRRSTVLVFTLLTLFFIYRDGAALVRQLRRLANSLFGPPGEELGKHMVAAVRGTVNGLVLVGMGEGVLLGVTYAALGLPRPALLGALTAVLAMIPFGAPLVFGAGAALLLVQSQLTAAIILFGIGSAVVFVADHFIRPVLIGGAVQLPFLWVLLGILGGLESLGLLGLFLGPAIMAALMALWREWVGTD